MPSTRGGGACSYGSGAPNCWPLSDTLSATPPGLAPLGALHRSSPSLTYVAGRTAVLGSAAPKRQR